MGLDDILNILNKHMKDAYSKCVLFFLIHFYPHRSSRLSSPSNKRKGEKDIVLWQLLLWSKSLIILLPCEGKFT